jgi:hypothetical protein
VVVRARRGGFPAQAFSLTVEEGLGLRRDGTLVIDNSDVCNNKIRTQDTRSVKVRFDISEVSQEEKFGAMLVSPKEWRAGRKKADSEWPDARTEAVNTLYKPTLVKVKPLAIPLPEKYAGQRFFRPELPRDPYKTPLVLPPPTFEYGGRLTEERMKEISFGPEGWLNDEERQLMLSVLRLREQAIAFDDTEKGTLSREYAKDYEIPVIEHKPWNDASIPIPRALYPKVVELLKKEVEAGDLEPSSAPYATRWFTVAKKNGKIRKVVDASPMNSITIRDTGRPPVIDEMIQEFVGFETYALFDLYRGYEQRWLSEKSRDMTSIRTPIGLLRCTKLPQGACNSPAEFQRTMAWVLQDEIPDVCIPFLDDAGVKGSASNYGGELMPGSTVRRFIFEHAVKVERILYRLEHANVTVSGPKMVLITPALEIAGS